MDLQQIADVAEQIGRAGGWPTALFLVLILVGGVVSGRLVSAQQAKDIRADRAERLAAANERVSEIKAEAERWRAAHAAAEDVRRDQTDLLREVLAGLTSAPTQIGSGRHVGTAPEG